MTRARTWERRHGDCMVIAEARGTSDILLHGREEGVRATLRMSLQVHTDVTLAGRFGYYGEMFLTRPGAQEEFIGLINSWHVERSSDEWEDTFLGEDGIMTGDMASMREFFSHVYGILPEQPDRDQSGNLLPMESVREHFAAPWAMLNDNTDIIYISTIWIHRNFTGRRIIDQGFELFFRLMTGGTLPEPYNLDRPLTVLLVPGLLQGEYQVNWDHPSGRGRMDLATRITTIASAYERNGFMRLSRPESPNIRGMDEEMGRRVDPGDYPAAAGDIAIMPPDPPDTDLSTPSPIRKL
ncbi:hypothetical protein UCDDA912_g09608 [Diaporthe ampelina]|uniref:Uncharacterized protein n=1 Tax=Diaporthe ampelina TaxID=1214573 RepID=A0A0G2HQI9_9PEZI|nr:hypothetical protein UCDDA912_g09608 [Diaporthe ampelina]